MSAEKIIQQCEEIKEMLLAKNKAYGDSALNPVRVFSKADSVEQIRVRLDDKLSRIMRGNEFAGDDTIKDLIGYLILMQIAIKRAEEKQNNDSISSMIKDVLSEDVVESLNESLKDRACHETLYNDEIEECIKGAKLYANTET